MEAIIKEDNYNFMFTDSQHGSFNEKILVNFRENANDFKIPTQFRTNTHKAYLCDWEHIGSWAGKH